MVTQSARDVFVVKLDPFGSVIYATCFGGSGDDAASALAVDASGNVYVTGPGGIWVWDPDGHQLGTILTPESCANFNWGDADFKTIYIAGRTSVYRLKTKTTGFVAGTSAK